MRVLVFVLMIVMGLAVSAQAQTSMLKWTPPTLLEDGSAVPVGEQLKYKIFAGPTANDADLTERAQTAIPEVDVATLALQPGDLWVAVETFSDVRVGVLSKVVQVVPVDVTFSIRAVTTIP